jgi:hypothetical protein
MGEQLCNYQERSAAKQYLNGNESYVKTYALTDLLKHDMYPETTVAYATRVKKSRSLIARTNLR